MTAFVFLEVLPTSEGDVHCLFENGVPSGEAGHSPACLPQKLLPLYSLQHKAWVSLCTACFLHHDFIQFIFNDTSKFVISTTILCLNKIYILATFFLVWGTMLLYMGTSTASPISVSCSKPKATMMKASAIVLIKSCGNRELMEKQVRKP